MPRTVEEGFRDFLPKLTPTPGETEAARKHRASIEARLKSDLERTRFFRIGSFGNGTSISAYSDVDYLASIPAKHLYKDSAASLRKVKLSLAERFPNTGVAVDCPAVVVPFGTLKKETTEVVPAYFVGSSGEHSVYRIPDCSGGWMKASPEAHTAYVKRVDKKHGGKVRSLIRFIKAWKFFRNVPISSFYLELRVAKYADAETAIIYSIDVRRILAHLDSIGLARMQDPLGISGYIPACRSAASLATAQSKLARASSRANKARDAEDGGNVRDAFYWWNLLFAERFPSYYR